MNKFQKIAYKIVKYEIKTDLWSGKRAKYKIGRSISSTTRIYAKTFLRDNYDIKQALEIKNQLNWI